MENEKEVLLELYKNKSKESRRAHAILLFNEGHKISEITKTFLSMKTQLEIRLKNEMKKKQLMTN